MKRLKLILNAIPLININTGISRYLRCLYETLEALYGERLDIAYFDGVHACTAMPRGPANLGQWSANVARFWRLPTSAAVSIRMAWQLHREILFRKAARRFDLYHEAAFFPFAPRKGLKTIFTIHDLSLQRYPQYHPSERVFFCKLFFNRRLKEIDHILTVSRFTRDEVLTCLAPWLSLGQDRITVTPLAHDHRVFHPRPPHEVNRARQRFHLPQEYFIFVGTGDPRKNMDVVPDALRRAQLDIPLVVAGWRGWAETGKPAESRVIFLGYTSDEDLAVLYSGALGLVMPSLYEGFGLPILEAMACGCPVVCSSMASLPEVAGDAALYIETPLNPDSLADHVSRLAYDRSLREDLSARGKKRAACFSWEETARKTFEVFQSVCSPTPPGH